MADKPEKKKPDKRVHDAKLESEMNERFEEAVLRGIRNAKPKPKPGAKRQKFSVGE